MRNKPMYQENEGVTYDCERKFSSQHEGCKLTQEIKKKYIYIY